MYNVHACVVGDTKCVYACVCVCVCYLLVSLYAGRNFQANL